jgi:SAM-dependent methyltransferase
VDELVERRVQRGALACANCRTRYPIVRGTGDFTLGEVADFGAPVAAAAAVRLVALAGVTSPRARLLVAGPAAAHASAIAAEVPDVDVIAAGGDPDTAEEPGVNRVAVAESLPFHGGRFAGVVLSGQAARSLLNEGARVLSPGGRLVLEPAPADARELVQRAGLTTLAAEAATLVAVRT